MKLRQGKLIYCDNECSPPIRIFQSGPYRWLKFGDNAIQSAMNTNAPEQLVLEYMRRMMSFLIFQDPPGRTLHAGIGAGAMLRFFYHHWPDCDVHAVDNHLPLIESITDHFGLPPLPSSSLHIMDIHTYLGQVNHEPFDIILADLFDDDSSIDVWSEELVQLCYENLSEQGFLIINLLPHNPAAFTRLVNHIRNTFSKLTFCMTVPEHDNVLVFATRSKSGIACSEELPQKAALLEKKYPLEMALYCDNILTTNASSPLFSHHR